MGANGRGACLLVERGHGFALTPLPSTICRALAHQALHLCVRPIAKLRCTRFLSDGDRLADEHGQVRRGRTRHAREVRREGLVDECCARSVRGIGEADGNDVPPGSGGGHEGSRVKGVHAIAREGRAFREDDDVGLLVEERPNGADGIGAAHHVGAIDEHRSHRACRHADQRPVRQVRTTDQCRPPNARSRTGKCPPSSGDWRRRGARGQEAARPRRMRTRTPNSRRRAVHHAPTHRSRTASRSPGALRFSCARRPGSIAPVTAPESRNARGPSQFASRAQKNLLMPKAIHSKPRRVSERFRHVALSTCKSRWPESRSNQGPHMAGKGGILDGCPS